MNGTFFFNLVFEMEISYITQESDNNVKHITRIRNSHD